MRTIAIRITKGGNEDQNLEYCGHILGEKSAAKIYNKVLSEYIPLKTRVAALQNEVTELRKQLDVQRAFFTDALEQISIEKRERFMTEEILSEKQMESIQQAINKEGSKEYSSPSGAFIEFLRELAVSLELDAFAEACNVYCKRFPIKSKFIASRVPGILINNYFPNPNCGVDYQSFVRWALANPEWAQDVKTHFRDSTTFQNTVSSIIQRSTLKKS